MLVRIRVVTATTLADAISPKRRIQTLVVPPSPRTPWPSRSTSTKPRIAAIAGAVILRAHPIHCIVAELVPSVADQHLAKVTTTAWPEVICGRPHGKLQILGIGWYRQAMSRPEGCTIAPATVARKEVGTSQGSGGACRRGGGTRSRRSRVSSRGKRC